MSWKDSKEISQKSCNLFNSVYDKCKDLHKLTKH